MDLHEVSVDCPCCGERIALLVDTSAGSQEYIEDCCVCCRPIVVTVSIADGGALDIQVRDENSC